MNNLIVKNIDQIATPIGHSKLKGAQMQALKVYENHTLIVENGIIVEITQDTDCIKRYADRHFKVIDGNGRCLIPGYIDSHTHLVFGGYRPEEFDMRLKGVPYMEIMKQGGGIANTVEATRTASIEHLIAIGAEHLAEMMSMGVTTVEAKSGYGLDLETELKQLKVVKALKRITPLTLVSTFLGAHAVPKSADSPETFITDLNNNVLPEVKNQALATFVDIFCEDHVFDLENSRKHLEEAKRLGFKLKMHADEIVPLGGASLAVALGATSADHLLNVTDKGILDLAGSETVATLLPCTAFTLRESYAPARRLIDAGCSVALATDFNPGSCFTHAIPLLIALSTLEMHMTIEEVITALTLNAAAALDMADTHGSIEIGKQADFTLHRFPSYKFIGYHVGMNTVSHVVKHGALIFEKGK